MNIKYFAMNPSRVVQFLNMVSPEDLLDDLEYEDIRSDVMHECRNYGDVLDIIIPRPDKVSQYFH